MKKLTNQLLVVLIMVVSLVGATSFFVPLSANAASGQCSNKSNSLLGLPHWYDGLPLKQGLNACSVDITSPDAIWTILVNILEILLYFAGLIAVLFVIYGGIRYIMSQGDPSGVTNAKQTIVRALGGLVIAIVAVVLVQFVIGIFHLHASGGTYKISLLLGGRYV